MYLFTESDPNCRLSWDASKGSNKKPMISLWPRHGHMWAPWTSTFSRQNIRYVNVMFDRRIQKLRQSDATSSKLPEMLCTYAEGRRGVNVCACACVCVRSCALLTLWFKTFIICSHVRLRVWIWARSRSAASPAALVRWDQAATPRSVRQYWPTCLSSNKWEAKALPVSMTLHPLQEYDVVALHPAIFDFQLFSQEPLRARQPPKDIWKCAVCIQRYHTETIPLRSPFWTTWLSK